MKKLIVLVVLLAFVPILVPAEADALTLRQRVSRLEGNINCLRRIPVIQHNDFAAYGDPVDGPNKANTYDTASPTSTSNDNPDSLTDLGATTGLDWGFPITGFPAPPPDYFVLAIRADANNVPYPGCAAEFGLQSKPSWWSRSARLMHLRQLARAHSAELEEARVRGPLSS
jgi:hypothetical protein